MTKRTPSHRATVLSRWIVTIGYSLVILSTLSLVRTARDALNAAIGEKGFSLVVTGAFLLCGLGGVLWIVRRGFYRSFRRTAVILVSVGLYALCIGRLELAVERIHYLQYGIAAILALRALRLSFPNAGAYLLALSFVLALGATDEGLQWVLPNRVGELRDIWINLTAGVLGLCLAAAVDSFDTRALIPDRRTTSTLFWTVAGLVLVFALFTHYVHGFGHCHSLPNGTRFKSAFTREELAVVAQDPDAVAWEDFSRSPLAVRGEGPVWAHLQQRLIQWKALRHPTTHAFNYEAWRHRQQRDGLANPRYEKYREALEEHRILSSAYPSYVEAFDLSWPAEKKDRFADYPFRNDPEYMSPVQELLVTTIRPSVFWLLTTGASLLCLLLGIAVRIRKSTETMTINEP